MIDVETYNITVYKGSKFYEQFQLVQSDLTPISLVGKTLKGTIKESLKATANLFELTEANGGLTKVDAANGIFTMLLDSSQTNISASRGVYDIMQINDTYPDDESEYIVRGSVNFIQGITQQ